MTTIRREFLKQGALTVAGMAVAAPYGMAVNSAPKKVRVAIVGGGFGMGFYFHEHPDCVVEAVSDLRRDRRERLMKYYRCQKLKFYHMFVSDFLLNEILLT